MSRRVPVIETAGGRPGQIGIVVDNLERGLAAYGAPAHVAPWRIWTYDGAFVPERQYRGAAGSWAARIALGGTNPQVELIEPLAGPSIYHEWRDEQGAGLHHLGFYVADCRAAVAAMESAGFAVLQAGFGFGSDRSGGFAYFDTRDAVGFIVEAIEVPASRVEPERVVAGL